jgi:cell division protein FtsB
MPNIANLLKSEIARVARREVRAETKGLKQAIAPYRAQIAELKRRTRELEQQVNRLGRVAKKTAASAPRDSRRSASGWACRRRRSAR